MHGRTRLWMTPFLEYGRWPRCFRRACIPMLFYLNAVFEVLGKIPFWWCSRWYSFLRVSRDVIVLLSRESHRPRPKLAPPTLPLPPLSCRRCRVAVCRSLPKSRALQEGQEAFHHSCQLLRQQCDLSTKASRNL